MWQERVSAAEQERDRAVEEARALRRDRTELLDLQRQRDEAHATQVCPRAALACRQASHARHRPAQQVGSLETQLRERREVLERTQRQLDQALERQRVSAPDLALPRLWAQAQQACMAGLQSGPNGLAALRAELQAAHERATAQRQPLLAEVRALREMEGVHRQAMEEAEQAWQRERQRLQQAADATEDRVRAAEQRMQAQQEQARSEAERWNAVAQRLEEHLRARCAVACSAVLRGDGAHVGCVQGAAVGSAGAGADAGAGGAGGAGACASLLLTSAALAWDDITCARTRLRRRRRARRA